MKYLFCNVHYLAWFIFSLILALPVFGWNNVGHRLVAQIALDNLDNGTKKILNQYNRSVDHSFASYSLLSAAFWLDTLYKPEDRYLKPYHYIDFPYTSDNTLTEPAASINAVYAIKKSMSMLADKNTSEVKKGFYLRVLLHVVGDIHQPLHCISKFSSNYPKGDRGGNLVVLKSNPIAMNLHAYWDRAGGLLLTKKTPIKKMKRWAARIEKKWPCNTSTIIIDPAGWAIESYKLAVKYVYTINEYEKPSKAYKKQTRALAEQRIALAGCRLAAALKQVTR